MTSNNNNNGNPYKSHSKACDSFLYKFLTAGVSSSISCTIMAPVERAKLIVQVHKSCMDEIEIMERPYTSFTDVMTRLVKEQGFLSLWRGNMASVIRCFPYIALNFAFKDKYQTMFLNAIPEKNTYQRLGASLLAGGIGGSTALTIVYPLDFARTRMAVNMQKEMAKNLTKDPHDYHERKISLKKTLLKTYRRDGIFAFYRGFCISILGVFTYRSIYFGLYDVEKFFTPVEHRGFFVSLLEAEVASIISGLCSYPMDTVRRSIMVRDKTKELRNARYYIKKIYKHQGILGFYHGAGINMVRGTGGAILLVLNDFFQGLCFGITSQEPWSSTSKLPPASSLRIPPFGGPPFIPIASPPVLKRRESSDKDKSQTDKVDSADPANKKDDKDNNEKVDPTNKKVVKDKDNGK